MTTEDQGKGGAQWELGRAATRMVEAFASGDPEKTKAAMSDYAAALGSQATSSMAAIAQVLISKFEDLDRRLDGKDRAELDWRVELRTQIESMTDTYSREVDNILATLGEVVAHTKKLQNTVDVLASREDARDEVANDRWGHTQKFELESMNDRANIRTEVASLREMLDRVLEQFSDFKSRVEQYMLSNRRSEFDSMKRRLRSLEEKSKSSDDSS